MFLVLLFKEWRKVFILKKSVLILFMLSCNILLNEIWCFMFIGIFYKRWDRLKKDKKKICNVFVSIKII